MVKVTFTLDDETVAALRRSAERFGKPQSLIVREAVREYDARAGRLSEEERRQMLRSIDAFLAHPPLRTQADAAREAREVRRARRKGGRRAT